VPIPPNTLVTLDLGARLDGYCSDCTRTWATGELPDDLAEAWQLVREAQESALGAVVPGRTWREVDAVARERISAAGHGEHFGHPLGHGVGLEVHEGPRLAASNQAPLAAGNVVTVEPGIYLPGRGGVRIEDLVAVSGSGPEVLTGLDKRLRHVD
jgi:Xaa-Pro aminopeptidase